MSAITQLYVSYSSVLSSIGMGVFTGTFSMAVLLISTICLPMAEVTVFIPRTSGAMGQIVATTYHLIANLLYYALLIIL